MRRAREFPDGHSPLLSGTHIGMPPCLPVSHLKPSGQPVIVQSPSGGARSGDSARSGDVGGGIIVGGDGIIIVGGVGPDGGDPGGADAPGRPTGSIVNEQPPASTIARSSLRTLPS